jgi:hypothetical protein
MLPPALSDRHVTNPFNLGLPLSYAAWLDAECALTLSPGGQCLEKLGSIVIAAKNIVANTSSIAAHDTMWSLSHTAS